jgi:hypothetical protein
LTWRESLRDIEACLRAQSSKLYHLGFRNAIARNTLANANAVRVALTVGERFDLIVAPLGYLAVKDIPSWDPSQT